jgi:serine/threonine protein kinase
MDKQRWKRIDQLLQSAFDLPENEREAFLDRACAGDDEMRHEIISLLNAEDRAGGFLNQSPMKRELERTSPAIGARVGAYRITREIGRGGMGAVYLAERADRQFKQKVAIKLIKRGMDTDEIVRRFRYERQILASLNHPNIARLLDGGATEAGLPFFVMEYIEGEPLIEYCDRHKLDTTKRLKLFLQVCAAVQHAHNNLVIHRDIKPSNILISEDGEVKLLDFGIAKLLNTEEAGLSSLLGQRPMTPEYASPEQARGQNLTTASDVYALGVVLYELLSGHRPYRFPNRAPEEVARVICEQEPEKPSSAINHVLEESFPDGHPQVARTPESVSAPREGQLEKLRRRLNGDLDNIILTALRKEPERRYQSPAQLAEDIERSLDGRVVTARRNTFGYRSGKFIRRNKAGVAAGTLVMTALFAGIVATMWQARIAHAERDRAEIQRNRAENEQGRAKAQSLRAESEQLRAEENLRRAEQSQARAETALREALAAETRAEMEKRRAEGNFNDVRTLANALLFEFHDAIEKLPGSTPVRQKLIARGLDYLDRLSREAGDEPMINRELASGYLKLGDLQGRPEQSSLGDTRGARQSYQKALAILTRLSDANPDDIDVIREASTIYSRLGEIAAATGDEAAGQRQFQRALELRQRVLAANPTDARARDGIALTYLVMGQNTTDSLRKLDHYRRSLKLRAEIAAQYPNDPKTKPDLRGSYLRVGDVLMDISRFSEAVAHYRAALGIDEQLAESSLGNARFIGYLCVSHFRVGKALARIGASEESIEHCAKGLAAAQQRVAIDPNNSDARHELINSHLLFGDRLIEAGRQSEALIKFRQGVMLAANMVEIEPTNWRFRSDLSKLQHAAGALLSTRGEMAEAGRFIQQSLSLTESLVAEAPQQRRNQLLLWESLFLRSDWLSRAGETGAALEESRRALSVIETLLNKYHAEPEYRVNLAKTLAQLGDIHLALALTPHVTMMGNDQQVFLARDYAQRSLAVARDLLQRNLWIVETQKQIEHATNLLECAEKSVAAFAAPPGKVSQH